MSSQHRTLHVGRFYCRAALFGLLAVAVSPAKAETLARIQVELRVSGGSSEGTVLSLHSPQAAALVRPSDAVMDQRARRFEPDLLVVAPGSRVAFPNSDNIRHHVYSFSAARRFELPLYSGTPSAPIDFPEPGVVDVGCNIHDWMTAHILVLDTPYFELVSGDRQRIELRAPAGAYRLRVWHRRLQTDPPWIEHEVALFDSNEPALQSIEMALGPDTGPPLSDDAKLRELQQRFRALRGEP